MIHCTLEIDLCDDGQESNSVSCWFCVVDHRLFFIHSFTHFHPLSEHQSVYGMFLIVTNTQLVGLGDARSSPFLFVSSPHLRLLFSPSVSQTTFLSPCSLARVCHPYVSSSDVSQRLRLTNTRARARFVFFAPPPHLLPPSDLARRALQPATFSQSNQLSSTWHGPRRNARSELREASAGGRGVVRACVCACVGVCLLSEAGRGDLAERRQHLSGSEVKRQHETKSRHRSLGRTQQKIL